MAQKQRKMIVIKDAGGQAVIRYACESVRRVSLREQAYPDSHGSPVEIRIDVRPAGFLQFQVAHDSSGRSLFDELRRALADGGTVRLPDILLWANFAEALPCA